MTAFGVMERAPVSLRGATGYLLGIAGLTFSLTIIWLTMRAVMGIGGSCASGGPYVPAVECPDAVIVLMPVSMFGLFLFGGLAAWGGAALGGSWVALLALGWPALFLSLGWNFLEFGLRPPGGEPGEVVWSWLFCAVVFGLMGGIPLALGLWGLRAANATPRANAGGRIAISPKGGLDAVRQMSQALVGAERAERANVRGADAGLDVTARLERLARLRAAGDLTDAEFDAAKRATIDEARQ